MSLSEDVGFTRVRPWCCWNHPGYLGAFVSGRSVHSRASWGSLGSSGVGAIIHARPGGRWVHPGSLGSLAQALGVLGSLGIVLFTRVKPWGRWVLPACPGCRCFHSRQLWVSLSLSWVGEFTRACSGGRWIHPGRWVHSRMSWG